MAEGVRLQNLRDFTVQIRNAADDIVGTGIAVSMDGRVVTCRHVVEEAVKSKVIDGAEVGVYFPQARGGEEKKYAARVEKFFPQHDDDVVLLKLTGGASPLAPEQVAVLGTSEFSEGNPFRTYGYSPIGNYPASRGEGTILGTIEPPVDATLQVDPVQLKTRDIAAGMSGAAVLDTVRNHVVGLVAERYYPKNVVQDEFAYALDTQVLTFPPFEFMLQGEALALKPAPEFKLDKDLFAQALEIARYALAHRQPGERDAWHNAPTLLPEWTGREQLLAHLTEDWADPAKHVTGLVAFGGEGKSSLARKWVDVIGKGDPLGRPYEAPDDIFWWGFYENRSVDEFLEAALKYLSGGRIDPKQVPSSSLRAQIIGAMLGMGRYLFVLDGFEVMQHQDGDQYGLVASNDLRDLLSYFARPDSRSFCLITSRAPLLDLMEYTTYTHRDVDRLSETDGVALLEKLGVRGDAGQMQAVIKDWDGHALTISLIGSYLAEKHGGELAHLADLPAPTADEPRYERVHRVLRRYDEHLTADERKFLALFAAFRTPVHTDAFDKVFAPLMGIAVGAIRESPLRKLANRVFGQKDDLAVVGARHVVPLREMVSRLVTYRILKHDPASQTYTAHPLVRNHYLAHLTHDTGAPDTHLKIKDYYLSIAGDTPTYPTLDDLKPLIEVVHHACQAGAYDEAYRINYDRIYQGYPARTLVNKLGAWETAYSLMLEFFPDRDANQEPLPTSSDNKRWILNEIGLCLMNLGRLREAVPFYERKNELYEKTSNGYQNLADLHASLGALEASVESARQALDLARRSEDKFGISQSLSHQGWATHLQGELTLAGDVFKEAEKVEVERHNHDCNHLYSNRGIFHADHLRRTKQSDTARRVTEANLQICERNHWANQISWCHRVLGDLDADAGVQASAFQHYESALKIARGISHRTTLIEALLARGRWAARYIVVGSSDPGNGQGNPAPTIDDAFNDLNEALNYAVEGGYRIYEADIRVALGWAWLGASGTDVPGVRDAEEDQKSKIANLKFARAEAERALSMSREMGYHWGMVDAEELLSVISGKG